jgi:hypothetical protein
MVGCRDPRREEVERAVPFLLRVELPDVPGSLGRVATAIGEAGGDIEAIEIVEHRPDGTAVDDFLLEMAPGMMPDSVVSACNILDGVHVVWVSRYAAGGNLFLDLEVVEALTEDPASARDRLIDLLPIAFRVDWAARVTPGTDGVAATVVHATDAAPSTYDIDHERVPVPTRLPGDEVYVECAAPFGDDFVLLGRRGGPEFLDSELARLEHLVGLAMTISH